MLDVTSTHRTRSVAAGFARHGMPPPASNDTGTALGQDGSDWSRDLATLTFDLWGRGACGWCGSSSFIRIQSLKFVGLAVRKICSTMCVSINGPGDLELWPFDLETGVRVASKVGNLSSKFGHTRPLGSLIIRDGRTDGRTDGQKQGLKLCVFWHKVCSWLCQVCSWLCWSVLCEVAKCNGDFNDEQI